MRRPESMEANKVKIPRVSPQILVWARETAGLTLAEAAKRLKVKEEKLVRFESDNPQPIDRALIVKMAKLYRRPLLTFYLPQVPKAGVRGEDFRTLPTDYTVTDAALVDALIRDIRARQSIVREVLETEDDVEPRSFIGTMSLSEGVVAAVRRLRSILGLTREEYRKATTEHEAFKRLRQHAEACGIFVVLQGDLGHHTSRISLETFRGFALADQIAPFVVINDQDSISAWSFTLLHEIVHLCLGESGVSNGQPQSAIEQFCNDVASEYLVDGSELALIQVNNFTLFEEAHVKITSFARSRRLSSTMVSFRLFQAGLIDFDLWRKLRSFYREMWRRSQQRKREIAATDSGPNYYVVRRHRIGDALLGFARRMLSEGALSTTKAAKVLAVNPQGVGPLLAM